MTATGTRGKQRHLNELRIERDRPAPVSRAALEADAARSRADAAATLTLSSDERAEAVAQAEAALCDYLRLVGVGGEFQSARFSSWLVGAGRRPAALDPRAVGGLIIRARGAGLIAPTGECRPNGGIRETGTHGSPRAVWRVVRAPVGRTLRGGQR